MTLGQRPCKCLRTYRDPKYKRVNVVFKEGATIPSALIDRYTFCDSQCELCGGTGFITETANSVQEVEALMRDFDRQLRKRGQ
jgi:hypothetical protein